jgi:hypothetical protein
MLDLESEAGVRNSESCGDEIRLAYRIILEKIEPILHAPGDES